MEKAFINGTTGLFSNITLATAKIVIGVQERLYVSNLSAQYNIGDTKNYNETTLLMLQKDKPDDFVIATDVTTTVRDFVRMCFYEIGIEIEFSGKGTAEKGVVIDIDEDKLASLGLAPDTLRFGQTVLSVDAQYFRPTEVKLLIGDLSKAKQKPGREPRYDLEALVKDMMVSDLERVKKDVFLIENGYKAHNYFE